MIFCSLSKSWQNALLSISALISTDFYGFRYTSYIYCILILSFSSRNTYQSLPNEGTTAVQSKCVNSPMLRKRISDLSWYARAHRDMSSNLIERLTFVRLFVSILVRNKVSEAENKCVGICTYCRSRSPQTDLPGDRRIMAALHLCDISAQQCCKKRVYNVYRCSIYWTHSAHHQAVHS